mmetsp:Transcript_90189/g.179432  ORF Transcript_90189/g.179432 Transcript_90189/m.179432 type:complete len:402 (-) Transcript_90189:69-1274(-)
MTTPDILETVGFEKRKVGSGDKELGYVIKKKSLNGLVVGVAAIFGVLAVVVVITQFEVRFEKRSFHRKLRKEEHHAASKLAQVEMELWAQYRDDIHESHEANAMLTSLSTSYDSFQASLQKTITTAAKDLNLNSDKAAHLADVILHLVADLRKDNLQHAKHLVDHLVAAGKRSIKLEKHVEKELKEEMEVEEKNMRKDEEEGIADDIDKFEGSGGLDGETNSTDPLKSMLDGFFFTFNDYETEFRDKARSTLTPRHPVYKQLQALWSNISSPNPPDEEDVAVALDKIDLSSVGAGLGSGRLLPAQDIVEELLLIPKIPHKEIKELEKKWQSGSEDSVSVFGKLEEYYNKKLIPSGWLRQGVDRDYDEEAKEEEREEREEEEEEAEEEEKKKVSKHGAGAKV